MPISVCVCVSMFVWVCMPAALATFCIVWMRVACLIVASNKCVGKSRAAVLFIHSTYHYVGVYVCVCAYMWVQIYIYINIYSIATGTHHSISLFESAYPCAASNKAHLVGSLLV